MKRIKSLMILLVVLILIPLKVNAASASINVSTSGKAVVGNTITATVTVSSGTPMGSWQFNVNYDNSKLKLVGGTTSVADYTTSASGVKSKSYTLKFQVLKNGNASINIGSYLVYAIDESQMSVSTGNASIKIMTQAELEATYSKNNNLKKLEIEGYEISPEFNKDTLEYTAIVPSTVDKINIIAAKEDSTASIEGSGEKEVKEGANPFEIVVTAQNGSSKTYKLVVTVEDVNPIEVTINGVDYNVVKRADNIENKPKGFEETTITIDEVEVPAFKNDVLGITLVGIKDSEGNVKLAIYNDGDYSIYQDFTSNNLTIYLLELKELKGYEKTTITINDVEVEAYKYGNEDFFVVYGKNIETGEESYYLYDEKENTFQRFNDQQVEKYEKQIQNYKYAVYAFSGCLILIFICFILSRIVSAKRKRKIKESKLEIAVESEIEKKEELENKNKSKRRK